MIGPRALVCIVAIIATCALAADAVAQAGGGYDLHWNTYAGGSASMTGADYSLTGTDGAAAITTMQSNAGYMLRGGFWVGVHETGDSVFHSGFEPPP